MERFEGIEEGPLTISRSDFDGGVKLIFQGKSILRDPAELLQPVLFQMLEDGDRDGTRLVLDFRGLTYMNSSTFTPLVKVLEKARLGESKVTVLYDSEQKWQSVSFTALVIFDTGDGRVSVRGQE